MEGAPYAYLVATEVASRRGDRLRSVAVLVLGHVARSDVHVWLRCTRVGRYVVFIQVFSGMAVIFIFLVASGCKVLYYLRCVRQLIWIEGTTILPTGLRIWCGKFVKKKKKIVSM